MGTRTPGKEVKVSCSEVGNEGNSINEESRTMRAEKEYFREH